MYVVEAPPLILGHWVSTPTNTKVLKYGFCKKLLLYEWTSEQLSWTLFSSKLDWGLTAVENGQAILAATLTLFQPGGEGGGAD